MASLALSVLLLTACLIVPGTLINRSMTPSNVTALCLAPATSISVLSILALLYPHLKVRATFLSMVVGLLTASALFFLAGSKFHEIQLGSKMKIKTELLPLLLFLIIASSLAAYVFIATLDGPDCYFQAWDNQTHLRTIRAFADTGNFSTFNAQLYTDSRSAPFLPITESYFYPSAWHMLGAMLVSALNIPVPEAANSINIVCVCFILPMAMLACLKEMGVTNPKALALSAVLCVGVPIFPWDLISYGPLYPNLLGFCLLPGEIALAIHILNEYPEWTVRLKFSNVSLFLLGIVSLALAHTNTIFSLGVILAPYVVVTTSKYICKHFPNLPQAMCRALPLLAIALIWLLFNQLPYMRSIVYCKWPAICSPVKAFFSAIFMGTTTHPIQIVAFLLVASGIVVSAKSRQYCLISAYVFLVVVYTIDAGTDLGIKPFFSGFWYNDYHRVSAMLGLVSTLLACSAIQFFFERAGRTDAIERRCISVTKTAALTSATALIMFYPSLPFFNKSEIQTPFGYQINEMRNQYDKGLIYYDVFSPLEEVFCRSTLTEINSNNSLVINNPDDGSLFAYSVYGTNMYYRTWNPPDREKETEASRLIRLHLNEIANNKEVQDAVRETGAKFVIQLDHGNETSEYRIQYNDVNEGKWSGIDSIDESTPGFTLIASSDDIRLYSIDEF